MPIKTNHELVAALRNVEANFKTLYVMGCFGAPLTGANVSRYCTNHPYNRQAARTKMIKAAAGKTPPVYGFDCVCFIKAMLWGWTGEAAKPYGGAAYNTNGVPDISADQMITKCSGVSTDFKDIAIGEAVWCEGHIGVYIGSGKAIECTPSWDNGVQITAVKNIGTITGLNARQWTKHGKLPYVKYEAAPQAPAFEKAAPTGAALTRLIKDAAAIIFSNEGSYGSINKDDNGAVSVGKVQWHGSRALALLKTVAGKNAVQAKSILGDVLFNEIIRSVASAWSTRIVTVEEATRLSALLVTAQGMEAQDAQAEADIGNYVQAGIKLGLTDGGALIYFADFANQYGAAAALLKNVTSAAIKNGGDVTDMFTATKAQTASYLSRRESVYKAVLALDSAGAAPAAVTPEETTVNNAVTDGVLSDKAYWLGVLTGKVAPSPVFVKAILDNTHKLINKI